MSITIDEMHGTTMLSIFGEIGVSPKSIAQLFKSIAFADIANYITIDEGGAIQAKKLERISKAKRLAVKKVKEHTVIKESADGSIVWKDSRIEYELEPKLPAVTYMAKLMGLEPSEKQDQTVSGTLNIRILGRKIPEDK